MPMCPTTCESSPAMTASHDQPGDGSRELRVGRPDLPVPQTPSITTHTGAHTHPVVREPCPSSSWPSRCVRVLGLLGHRHHSGQDRGCPESGTCVCPSVLSCLVAPTGPVLPVPWGAPSRSTTHPGEVFGSRIWASGSCTCNMSHVSENRPLCSGAEICKAKRVWV